jgi:hypothetical protein
LGIRSSDKKKIYKSKIKIEASSKYLASYLENLENHIKFNKFIKDMVSLYNYEINTVSDEKCQTLNSEVIYQVYDFKILSKMRDFIIFKNSKNIILNGKNFYLISMNSVPTEIEKKIKEEIIFSGHLNLINEMNQDNSKRSSTCGIVNIDKNELNNPMTNLNSKGQGEIFNETSVIYSCGYYIEELDDENSLLGFWIESEFSHDENLQDHVLKDYLSHLKKIRENILFDINK